MFSASLSTILPALHSVRRVAILGSTFMLSVLMVACGSDSPTAPTPAHGVRVTNSSLRTVNAVYVSPCSSDSWGDNRLSGTLAPLGVQSFSVPEPGCYDVRVVATDGHSWRRDDIAVQGTIGVKVE